jgi:hypothetical protein
MNHWDASAEALLARARRSEEVPEGARTRIRASVAASVALSAVAGASVSAVAAPTALAKLPAAVKAASSLLPAAGASVGSSGSIAFLAPMTVGVALGLSAISPSAVTTPVSPATSAGSVAAVASVKTPQKGLPAPLRQIPAESARDEASVDVPAVAVSAKSNGSSPSLAAEAAVLEHARLVLRQGDSELALRLLDQHRRDFPNGVLFFEALATRAVALCRLGRTEEGMRIGARLEATIPGSGSIAQVRHACGVQPPAPQKGGAE